MASVSAEAWVELEDDGETTDAMYRALVMKTRIVVPKSEGANQVGRFRNLELGDESRKVLASMVNRLLDEVCSDPVLELTQHQQAFVHGRDIVRDTPAMLRCFGDAVGARNGECPPLRMLPLGCTKGYNPLGREWVLRVLHNAKLQLSLNNIVASMLRSDSVLVTNGGERGSYEPFAGFPHGCPLPCFLYVIAIDPLLRALAAVDGGRIANGFVDGWSAGREGIDVLRRASDVIQEFETASGQRINREKSAIVPSRRLSAAEVRPCYDKSGWELRMSYSERLLGIYIGLDAGITDQHKHGVDKLDKALEIFTAARHWLSTVARIVVANIFLSTLFSCANRLVSMPSAIFRIVERILYPSSCRCPGAGWVSALQ